MGRAFNSRQTVSLSLSFSLSLPYLLPRIASTVREIERAPQYVKLILFFILGYVRHGQHRYALAFSSTIWTISYLTMSSWVQSVLARLPYAEREWDSNTGVASLSIRERGSTFFGRVSDSGLRNSLPFVVRMTKPAWKKEKGLMCRMRERYRKKR